MTPPLNNNTQGGARSPSAPFEASHSPSIGTPAITPSARQRPTRYSLLATRYSDGGSAAAFTLLEILVAIALTAMILIALNTFLFSMGELWGKNSETRLFDLHVRSVTRFLTNELRTAALPPIGKTGQSSFALKEIETLSAPNELALTFDLPSGSRLLRWPGRPLPEVACALVLRPEQGLYLLWQSRLEIDYDTTPPRETLITPLVTALSYEYYDPETRAWELDENARLDDDGAFTPPSRLRLTFTLRGMTRQVTIPLPTATQALPPY